MEIENFASIGSKLGNVYHKSQQNFNAKMDLISNSYSQEMNKNKENIQSLPLSNFNKMNPKDLKYQHCDSISSTSTSIVSPTHNESLSTSSFLDFIVKKPDMESEFKNDEENIFKKSMELHKSLKNYYVSQPHINNNRRIKLIDWMNEFSSLLNFNKKTFYHSILLMDLFFSKYKSEVPKEKLQLVGITCLLIAVKNEEVPVQDLRNFVGATDNTYTLDEIFSMEKVILQTLRWKINYPSLYDWGNLITLKWDFIMDNLLKEHQKNNSNIPVNHLKKFRNSPEYGNVILMRFYEMLDIILFDFEAMFYREKSLCLSLTYYLIGMSNNVFDINYIVTQIQDNDVNKMLLNTENNQLISNYNTWFISISKLYFGVSKEELEQYLKFTAFYFIMSFSDYANKQKNTQKLSDKSSDELNQIQQYNQDNQISIAKIWYFRAQISGKNISNDK